MNDTTLKNSIIKNLPTSLYLGLKRYQFRVFNNSQYKYFQSQRKKITSDGYSYKPFDDLKAIFVHIPKCAGVSVNKSLFGNLAGGHTTLDDYIKIFEPKCIENYFKFTFVRNPWDRVVSAYFFLHKGGFNSQDKKWFDQELSGYQDFDSFVRNWLNKENIWKWHHFRPQYHYILDPHQKIKLDFIGYLENISDDFEYIAKKMNIDIKLPMSNSSTHSSFEEYYSEETKDIVARVYSEDIELLGYDFHNQNIEQQIKLRRTY